MRRVRRFCPLLQATVQDANLRLEYALPRRSRQGGSLDEQDANWRVDQSRGNSAVGVLGGSGVALPKFASGQSASSEGAHCISYFIRSMCKFALPRLSGPAPFGLNSSTSSNGDDASLCARGDIAAARRRAGLEWESFGMLRRFNAGMSDR
jgi:hypothetical protein